jgi:hypothetical protein
MRTVAKRLRATSTASAPPVAFAGLNLHSKRAACGNYSVAHQYFLAPKTIELSELGFDRHRIKRACSIAKLPHRLDVVMMTLFVNRGRKIARYES